MVEREVLVSSLWHLVMGHVEWFKAAPGKVQTGYLEYFFFFTKKWSNTGIGFLDSRLISQAYLRSL